MLPGLPERLRYHWVTLDDPSYPLRGLKVSYVSKENHWRQDILLLVDSSLNSKGTDFSAGVVQEFFTYC